MKEKSWKEWIQKTFQRDKNIRLVVILGICGMGLIGLSSFWEPEKSASAPSQQEETLSLETYSQQLEEELRQIVTAITGEEQPTVVVTLEDSGRSLYASDERQNTQRDGGEVAAQERESNHILLEDSSGNQSALTITRTQPAVQGVVVVSQRGEDPAVQEKILNAVCTALHLSAARVCVTGSG